MHGYHERKLAEDSINKTRSVVLRNLVCTEDDSFRSPYDITSRLVFFKEILAAYIINYKKDFAHPPCFKCDITRRT